MALMVSVLTVSVSAADTVLTIRGPDELPAVGEEFTVTVEISGNPGLLSGQFTLKFDQEHLDCTDMNAGNVSKRCVVCMQSGRSQRRALSCGDCGALDRRRCPLRAYISSYRYGARLFI